MKRDMDLIRKILFALEGKDSAYKSDVKVDGYDSSTISYHVALLHDAGLVSEVDEHKSMGGKKHDCWPDRLTWQGHDFIDAARDEQRWGRAKAIANQAGGLSFGVLKKVLIRLMTEAAMSQMD